MDIAAIGSKLGEYAKKYRYVILVLVIGIALMLIPVGKDSSQPASEPTEAAKTEDPSLELTRILSQIRGAGKVQVLLTQHAGEKLVFQTDQDTSRDAVRLDTVIVTGSDRQEQGLVQQVLAPEYRGAIVVCQGADDAAVRLSIVEAVSDVTGLGADRISVLKMK